MYLVNWTVCVCTYLPFSLLDCPDSIKLRTPFQWSKYAENADRKKRKGNGSVVLLLLVLFEEQMRNSKVFCETELLNCT